MASKKRGTAVAAAAAEVPGPEPAPAKRARVTTEAPGPAGFLGRVKALTKEAARDQRVSWDEYFGGMALLAAARSPCERLHVGCVVVRDRRVLSMGYNGFFQGAPHQSIMAHGHGGLCYNCSIDICVTSGMCPFCRADIGQVVTIGLGRYEVDDDGRKVVPVIGPK